MSKKAKPKLYITRPYSGARFHVFGQDNRALCGKAMMLTVEKNQCEDVKGNEAYMRGQDCKACFKKAGLTVEAP